MPISVILVPAYTNTPCIFSNKSHGPLLSSPTFDVLWKENRKLSASYDWSPEEHCLLIKRYRKSNSNFTYSCSFIYLKFSPRFWRLCQVKKAWPLTFHGGNEKIFSCAHTNIIPVFFLFFSCFMSHYAREFLVKEASNHQIYLRLQAVIPGLFP